MIVYKKRWKQDVFAVITDEPQSEFDLKTYWTNWCAEFMANNPNTYAVTVRISPDFLAILPHIFGDVVTHLIEQADPPDEEGWTTMTLYFGSYEAARGYILGFGTMAEVLAPLEMRDDILRIASGIVDFYQLRARSQAFIKEK